ncbi:hypothetical protein K9O30_22435 [Clostridium bowmanii]|uniref:hypothetical protein n=1 Tax=Clostridium bowmanii TaxID=132925 RepID=UPI001C0DC40C|nr:hypothetical protein [Clostridium bowmanii]MBU3192156.1 hypothetical protein [Clostridium bowmanii]MCA1076415.1 hypothetical protein [Clostridium bowmanii]
MKPIISVTSNIDKSYNEFGFLSKIMDKRKIKLISSEYIKELDVKVTSVKFPPNFNEKAYLNNITYAKRICKSRQVQLSVKTLRPLDYNYFNSFQKRFLAFSIIKSIQLMLRIRNESLKNCCIVVYDAVDIINYDVILELARRSKYIVFLSQDLVKARRLADYITANFGVSPIVTNDELYATKISDFIISSKNMEFSSGKLVWLIDNSMVVRNNIVAVNDVSYNVPWSTLKVDFSLELIASVLCQMQERDIEKALKYNGIYLKEIKFNNNVIC